MLAYYFIPVHWLLFISSTYVWFQFTWYSERSFSFFSVCFSIFCLVVELSYRFRELKNLPLQFGFTQPLAAHGYVFSLLSSMFSGNLNFLIFDLFFSLLSPGIHFCTSFCHIGIVQV